MEILLDPEEKILCPYNSAHHILRKRMNTHLVKCKKNYPDAKLVECDFNVNHKIPEPELQYHHENCPDRNKIEIKIYQEEGQDLNKFPIYNTHVPTEESWDDYNYPTYNPNENIEKRDIIRGLDVESAAKRRDFRNMERKRLAQLNNNARSTEASRRRLVERNDSAPSTSERPLRDTPVHVSGEKPPDDIADLLKRIKIGSRTSFIPKT